ncbi:MAG: 50S ribosomal protein L21 [Planctomycetota bacterium]|nr:50S ribosomal protein L21 [Planctomycetota bacterium]
MYAVIAAGGQQHIVREGQFIQVNDPNLPVGEEVTFDSVMLFSDGEDTAIGRPILSEVTVTGEVKKILKGKKIHIHKYRRAKASETRIGHRQKYSLVKINKIERGE